jgi:hypothetical protein
MIVAAGRTFPQVGKIPIRRRRTSRTGEETGLRAADTGRHRPYGQLFSRFQAFTEPMPLPKSHPVLLV